MANNGTIRIEDLRKLLGKDEADKIIQSLAIASSKPLKLDQVAAVVEWSKNGAVGKGSLRMGPVFVAYFNRHPDRKAHLATWTSKVLTNKGFIG